MARGKKSKQKPDRRKNRIVKKSVKPGKKKNCSTNGRDIKHRDQFKRRFPDSTDVKNVKRRKVEDVSEEEDDDEQEDVYKQLLSAFAQKKSKINAAVESDDESENEADGGAQDNDDNDVLEDSWEPNLDGSDLEPSDISDEDGVLKSNLEVSSISGKSTVTNDVLLIKQESNNDDEDASSIFSNDEENTLQGDLPSNEDDPFVAHICQDLCEEAVETINQAKPPVQEEHIQWEALGRLVAKIPKLPEPSSTSKIALNVALTGPKIYAQGGKVPKRVTKLDLNQLHLRVQLHDSLARANKANIEHKGSEEILTACQLELFTLMNNYQDLYYPERTLQNGEEVRFVYCLHAANHILKTRNLVLHHNSRLNRKNCVDVPDKFRDQGLVRPKVLIIVPFREQARRTVEMLIKLLVPDETKGSVMNRKRFEDEFTGDELVMPKKNPRPEDYEKLFSGNTDDTFRLGITLTKKSLKLYADFYSADIIVASPLGLRMIVGAEGETERDYDFLASLEVVILDQAEVCLMQNWDHLLHVWDHFHLQPRESHGTDFSRVRLWAANGWAKHYRQTIVLSSVALLEFSSLLNKRCANYAGSVRVVNVIGSGTICQVLVQLPQVFQRLDATSVTQSLDVRFDFLIRKVIPDHADPLMAHTMIYVPSYFDYVRIRNYLRKQELSFVQICEYSKEEKVARARDMFYHSQVHFLLYSERFHFFRRPLIKGIRHLVFYQLPTIPHFYSEMCNQMQESNQNPHGGSESNMTVTVLYNKYDAPQLSAVVGTERASRMVTSDRNVHMFMAGE